MRPLAALVPVALLATPHPSSTEPKPIPDSVFVAMLASVPASSFEPGSAAILMYIDMEIASNALGVSANADDELDQLADVGIAIGLPQLFDRYALDIEGAEAEVGFSALDIVREVAVLLPPDSLYIDVTRTAPLDVVTALETNPLWSPQLTEVDSQHGPYFSWGDDMGPDLERRSPFRPLGQSGQLAVLGDETATTVRTLDRETMEAALGVYVGEVDSVVAGELVGPVVELLGDASVIQSVSVAAPPAQPYLGLTIAELATDEGRAAEVYLVHGDGDAATANAALVQHQLTDGIDVLTNQPLAELLPGAVVAVEGAVVHVTVSGDSSFHVLRQMLLSRALFPVG